ncbi:MAG: efflux RND transporter periplasmic adaptor subunit [Gemmobacter sp.]|uniref:efflux RND transporter periplasmic adaptor subunit n=1 Tax=Gemmobacter sp. TaxID=1898957 RepID=UPI001A46D797|nr:efflux RND transporter periplasmic adaptor subunit [Gemmobacter sp.]MBL8561651.1 efflux RND transporter periplasmic adaptor subunit [Gemmobacter sp.]
MRILTVLLISALPLSALPVGAQTGTETEGAPAERSSAAPAISVSAVSMRHLRDRVIAGGLVGAVEEVLVQPLVEGQPIETLEAEAGDFVEAGQVLATLSTSTLELSRSQLKAALAAARASVAQAEAGVLEARASADEAARVAERSKALNKSGNASQAALDQALATATASAARAEAAHQTLESAQAQVESAEAQLANVELNLTRTKVVAPVAGEVLSRNAQIGAVASAAGTPMFVLMKDGALEAKAEIAEADLVRLQPGMAALIRTAGNAEPLRGKVRLVEPGVNSTSRLGIARIAIENARTVRSGMYADAEILVAERDALAVPVSAVGSTAEGAILRKVDAKGIVSEVVVKTGIRDGAWVEITEGVAEGDQIVTKAGAFVRDGDHINPVLTATQ